MGREVRRVPRDWEHPRDEKGHLIPLFGSSFMECLREWNEDNAQWERGLERDWSSIGAKKGWKTKSREHANTPYSEYGGHRPRAEDHMPDWPDEERTHYQMYETCTEGKPISPVIETPEGLARWLADNVAKSFAGQTASYEAWLRVCQDGWAPSAVLIPGRGLVSGVEGMKTEPV